MTYADESLGLTGAKRTSWEQSNPRAVFERILIDNPEASTKGLRDLFWAAVADDSDCLRVIVDYFCTNALLAQTRPAGRTRARSRSKAAREAAAAAAAQKIAGDIAFLTLRMPNDKLLANCTGPDCRKIGGWVSGLAAKIPRGKTVRQVFNETQLQKYWAKAT